MNIISAKEFLLWKKKQLQKGGDVQSFQLMLDLLGGISHEELNLIKINPDRNLNLKTTLNNIQSIWEAHIFNSVPIQHLCGFTFWRDLKLKVSEQVLIPRPETELIIDIVFRILGKDREKLFFAELGTGSGAISICLALEKPLWEGIATDIDKNAIEIASNNFKFYSKNSNLKFTCGHWLNPLEDFKGNLDIIISNPPYIPKKYYQKLPNEVKNFEPKLALFGGEDGLEHISEIIINAPLYLKKNGWIILENHFDQGSNIKQLLFENGFTSVEVLKDFSGVGRFTIGRYK